MMKFTGYLVTVSRQIDRVTIVRVRAQLKLSSLSLTFTLKFTPKERGIVYVYAKEQL